MIGIIYALTEPDSHDIRYCGKTIQGLPNRLSGHKADVKRGLKSHVHNWLRKLYEIGQDPEAIVCEEVSLDGLDLTQQRQVMDEAETRWIRQFRALGFRLTNATNGGDGCHGREISEETRDKMRKSNRGRVHSDETRKLISEACLKKPASAILRGEKHPQYGKTQTWKDPEARGAHISASKTGVKNEKGAGENNGNSKINTTIAVSIYQDTRPYKDVAVEHGVNIKMVSDIKNGITWKYVTGHNPLNKRTKYKIDAKIAMEIFQASGGSHSEIARRFGVSREMVTSIKNGKRWKKITCLASEKGI